MKIIYGSSNKAKLEEKKNFFNNNNINVEVIYLKDINFNEEIDENGTTINKLLTELKEVPMNKRTAKFVCVLTSILKDGTKIVVRGETKGKIALKPGPMGKLTYGPVFMPDEFHGKVMNELSANELKHTHREKALIELLKELKQI